jgi:hypothetical protein
VVEASRSAAGASSPLSVPSMTCAVGLLVVECSEQSVVQVNSGPFEDAAARDDAFIRVPHMITIVTTPREMVRAKPARWTGATVTAFFHSPASGT